MAGKATALLVSVVNLAEAEAAFQGGAEIIDVKNPVEGPLGAPRPDVVAAICRDLRERRPVSVALGEFPGRPCAAALAAVGAALFQPDFLKVGFVGGTGAEEVTTVLQEIREGLTCAGFSPLPVVAVAYADTLHMSAWTLTEFAALAQAGRAAGCLVDTQEKNGVSLTAVLSCREIAAFIDACRHRGLFCGVAGSLQLADIAVLQNLGPDIIGVRSAACGGDRLKGRVTAERVRALKGLFTAGVDSAVAERFPGCDRWSLVRSAAQGDDR
ncbi:MAG: (5-formylfuran-3-yl)methyl phosphate synthase [Negativicutes bacterium]|nr:(5-formylfuran-3-yl)methyl phosphate synthase [Negativicutes bacterium]